MTKKATTIRQLNDELRKRPLTGQLFLSAGVAALDLRAVAAIVKAVVNYDDFSKANDPYGEHDFGNFTHDGVTYFWKIDYYDLNLEYGSEDPADPTVTKRVLTVMRADEY